MDRKKELGAQGRKISDDDYRLVQQARTVIQRLQFLTELVAQGRTSVRLLNGGDAYRAASEPLREMVDAVYSKRRFQKWFQYLVDYDVLTVSSTVRGGLDRARRSYRAERKAGVGESAALAHALAEAKHEVPNRGKYAFDDSRWSAIEEVISDHMHDVYSLGEATRKIGMLVLGPIYGVGEDAFREGALGRMKRWYRNTPDYGRFAMPGEVVFAGDKRPVIRRMHAEK